MFNFTDDEYKYVLEKTTKYACNEYESSKQKRFQRKQFNKDRIIQQNITGKIGEFAAMFYLLDQGKECNSPDMKVYNGSKKSFDADLMLNNRPLHVKSQSKTTSDYFNCVSWTFQKGGKGAGHTDPLTKKSVDDLIIFCHVDGQHVEIYGPYEWKDIKSLLKDPLLDRLKGIKQCIYLEDLKKIDI
tara:strand:- start:94 stop:651 length:558 start_codon:yes stop_codon:yes gene_type:complete